MWCSLLSSRPVDEIQNQEGYEENHEGDYDANRRENEEGDDAPPAKRMRFQPSGEEHLNEWELPEELAVYVNETMGKFVPEKQLKENILYENPVPNNIAQPKTLDVFMKELLEEQGKKHSLALEKDLLDIHQKATNILGPFSTLWAEFECEKDAALQDDTVKHLHEKMIKTCTVFEQSVTMISQVCNTLAYQRRLNILGAIFRDNKRAKDMMKEQKSIIDGDKTLLFGSKFEDFISRHVKSKKKTREIMGALAQPSTSGRGRSRPFQRGPLSQRGGGRGQGYVYGNNRSQFFRGRGQSRGQGRGQNFRGKNHKLNLSSKTSSRTSPLCSVPERTPSHKEAFSEGDSRAPSGRETKILSSELETVDFRLDYSKHSRGSGDPIHKGTITEEVPSSHPIKYFREGYCRPENKGDVRQRGDKESQAIKRPVCKFYLFSGQKGRGSPSSGELKGTEQVCPTHTLQNGRTSYVEGIATPRGLYDQTRFKGCILFSTVKSPLTEICQIRMGRCPLRISMSMFRSQSCPTDFYKGYENSHCTPKKAECKDNNISGRHPSYGTGSRRNNDSTRLINLPFAKSGLLNKHKKVYSNSLKKDRIPRNGDKFGKYGISFTPRESKQNYLSMQKCSEFPRFVSTDSLKTDRQIVINCSSNITSSTELSISAATTNSNFSLTRLLSGKIDTQPTGDIRVAVVDRKFRSEQRSVPSSEATRFSDKFRCLDKGMGGSLPRTDYRGTLVEGGITWAHKRVRAQGCNVSDKNIYSSEKSESLTHSDGQHSSNKIPGKNGRHSQSGTSEFEQTDLGIFATQRDHNYCRIPPREIKCRSRQRIPQCPGFQRVETGSTGVSKNNGKVGIPGDRSFCISTVTPDPKLHVMEIGPIQQGKGCFPDKLEQGSSLCLSPICVDRQSPKEGPEGSGQYDNHHTPLADSGMVPYHSADDCREPNLTSKSQGNAKKSTRGISSTTNTGVPKVSGLACLRSSLETEGISKRAVTLISSARRKGTNTHYESAWRRWTNWCDQRKVDPTRCDLKWILDFLAELFELGFEYNTIAGYRSSLSAFHEPINGVKIGEHPRVSSLLTGIFNTKPPKAKYNFVWDIDVVLKYLISLPEDDQLSDKLLTLKLASLLGISAASRASEICNLNIEFLTKHTTEYSFQFSSLSKTWRKGKARPEIKFKKFSSKPKICICAVIDSYLKRSAKWRKNETQLLLSFVNPHKPVKVKTVSRWLVETMQLSGIDVNIFKGHSVRSASTSKAASLGVPLVEIIKRGLWASDTMFKNVYNKPIITSENDYQTAIVNNLKL